MNPIHKISGKERRELRKHLAQLKRYRSRFWYIQDIETVYGNGMTKAEAEQEFTDLEKEIVEIEKQLAERI